jgi:multicomponent Na+:H+ antiporter subunit B
MRTVIFRTTSTLIIRLILLFAVFLLIRGHNSPGGGFIAGLVVVAAVALHSIAYDFKSARQLIRVRPAVLISSGLLLSVVSALPGLIWGSAFMTGQWAELSLSGNVTAKIGTPLVFDAGVFLVVIGVASTVLLYMSEER